MAQIKLSQLPVITSGELGSTDSIPVVDDSAGATKRITIEQLDDRYMSSGGEIITAGAGLTKTGTTLSVNTDGTTIDIDSNNLRVRPESVRDSEISLTAAIKFSKMENVASGNLIVGNGSSRPTSVAVTGDITLSNAGVVGIKDDTISNAKVKADAAIARSKLGTGTASHVVTNAVDGTFSSEAALAKVRGGTGADNTNVNFPTTGTIVTRNATETLLNKTLVNATINGGIFNGDEADGGNILIAPAAATGDLEALTRVAGAIYYDSSEGEFLGDNGGALNPLGSGGAGGMQVDWSQDIDSPISGFRGGFRVFDFGAGLGQKLFAAIKVPNGYRTGKPITMRTMFSSAETGSATLLFKTLSTLIKTTEAINSVVNQRISTNTAFALSSGTTGKLAAFVNDLSSVSGQINGINVGAGDLILIQLYRDTDTSTFDASMMPTTTEVTFG